MTVSTSVIRIGRLSTPKNKKKIRSKKKVRKKITAYEDFSAPVFRPTLIKGKPKKHSRKRRNIY